MMTLTSLKENIADWMHRTDLDARLDDFIDSAYANLNSVLRITEMESRTVLSLFSGIAALPDDWLETRSVVYLLEGGGKLELAATSVSEAGKFSTGAYPWVYTTFDYLVEIAPPEATAVNLTYYARQDVPTTSDFFMLHYPGMVRDASLEQAAIYTMDNSYAEAARARWTGSAAQANRESIRARLGSRARAARPSSPTSTVTAT